MRLALTGATGFVGRRVLDLALERGLYVRASTRRPQTLSHPNLDWVAGGLGESDAELVEDADALLNIAGLVKARTRADYFATNAEAVGALRAALDASNLTARFVQLSSLAAREPQLSSYAASKRGGERALEGRANTLVVRAPAVFGPGDTATEPLFRAMLRGVLPVPGGRGWRARRVAYVFVDDLARYLLDAVEGAETGVAYPATSPGLSWEAFHDLAQDAANRPIRLLPVPTPALLGVAGLTSVTSRLAGVGHLTLEKLREFRHPDWGVKNALPNATPMVEALERTFDSYR